MSFQKRDAMPEFFLPVTIAALEPDDLIERFHVRFAPEFGERCYMVKNLSNEHSSLVEFGIAEGGRRKLARCICADFRARRHVCKHMKAASPLHRWRMKMRQAEASSSAD